jgi:hypothetical protein
MIQSEGEQKVTVTTTTLAQDLSIQQKQVDKIVEEHMKIFLLHLWGCLCTTMSHIPLTWCLDAPLPNGPIYRCSLPENESLPYVQHSSIGHDPFQVCLGFQPLAPIDIALLVASSLTESSHTQTKEDHATIFVEWIQHLHQQVHDILPQAKYKQDNYFNKASGLTKVQIQQKFPHLPRELDAMGTIAS